MAVVIVRTSEPGIRMACLHLLWKETRFRLVRRISWACTGIKRLEMVFGLPGSQEPNAGSEGDGFVQSQKVLDGGRISIAALSVGITQGAF